MNNKAKFPGMLLAAAAIILFGLIMFRSALASGVTLFSTDNNIGHNAMIKSFLPGAFLGCWYDSILAGQGEYIPSSLTFGLLALMSPVFYTDWFHAICLCGASIFLLMYLRREGLGWAAAALGALAAWWLGANLTLTYAGHNSKYAILLFAAMFLWLMGRLPASDRRASGMIAAGGAMGMMIAEQADVGLFFALVLGPYALFVLWFKCRARGWIFGKLIMLLLAPAFLIALRPALEGYRANIKDVAAVDEESPGAKWEFVTQWSWPPDESIDFIAPGYTGWRSGEPAGPYWGRMGRSAGWETTGRGFQNFKLENVYLGALPVFLAVFALTAACVSLRRRHAVAAPSCRFNPEIWFWGIAMVVTLLLSFGKYFPLYYLFYKLPLVGNIRNPNKFLQIFQLTLAVLAAYGMDLVVKLRKNTAA